MRLLLILTMLLLPTTANTEASFRIRIAVVDTGLDVTNPKIAPYVCETGHVDLTGTGLADHVGHGTNVSFIISRGMDRAKECLVVVKWWDVSYIAPYADDVVKAAVGTGAKLVNLSYGGHNRSMLEDAVIRQALENGVTFVMAAGNEGQDLDLRCDYYPACSFAGVSGAHVAGALDHDGTKRLFSNYGRLVTDWADGSAVEGGGYVMTGTSQATANITARIAKELVPSAP